MGIPRRLVIIPSRAEPETLHAVVATVPAGLQADVLVLDSGGNPDVGGLGGHVKVLPAPEGNGRAVRLGLRYACVHGYHEIYRVDGDGQHDPTYLTSAAGQLGERVLVLGSRHHPDSPIRSAGPPDRLLLNLGMRHLVNQLTGLELTDVITGFWALDARLAHQLNQSLVTDGYGITLEIVLRLAGRARIREIPHPQIYRGSTKMTAKYHPDETAQRCRRAGDYLTVLTTTATALGLLQTGTPTETWS